MNPIIIKNNHTICYICQKEVSVEYCKTFSCDHLICIPCISKLIIRENFDFLIEYRYALKKDKSDYCSSDIDGYSTVIIGREIVTGTPIFSMLPSNYASTVEDAAKLGIIKKGKLIAKSLERVSVSKMSNYLNQMTNEEAYEYIRKVNQLKSIYPDYDFYDYKTNTNGRIYNPNTNELIPSFAFTVIIFYNKN